MSLWIKICGNTSVEDALLCADAGADAVGFVFAPSPRQVTPQQVAAIVPRLPQKLEKIGVFIDATPAEIVATVRTCGLTGVQLHFNAKVDMPHNLREAFGAEFRILRVLHYGESVGAEAVRLAGNRSIDAILVDSRTTTASGGTGMRFDWEAAKLSLFQNSEVSHRLVVAGGLTPENVGEAITTLHPWGVDVVSGVETLPGAKDDRKVRDFVARAKAVADQHERS